MQDKGTLSEPQVQGLKLWNRSGYKSEMGEPEMLRFSLGSLGDLQIKQPETLKPGVS